MVAAQLLQDEFHEVAIADADPATGEHGVAALRRLLQGLGQRPGFITDQAEVQPHKAVGPQTGQERSPVAVADLARR